MTTTASKPINNDILIDFIDAYCNFFSACKFSNPFDKVKVV